MPIDTEVADLASALRSRYTIRTPDALQIAAVLSADCEAFLTNDKALKQVKELEMIVLEDYLQ
ncbi:MAG: PIN domain-containing protein [Candidatus Electrothrix sp. AUS4]|nr:PIN domain-containing protein [Candidatus Electrothrix sp. AUS4]